MPKLIDYPRTNYSGSWELAEIVDDTGGKCAVETAAKKLNRKVSGSFKAIIGSSVKFGLITSKRDLLSTTTLFKRIKHAYDKQEELLFHREAFLTPPLFIQLCKKFRSKELPIQMLDIILIKEFGVEEINAQGVTKAFIEGCRMMELLNEHNIMTDVDNLSLQRTTQRTSNIDKFNINGLLEESEQNTQDGQPVHSNKGTGAAYVDKQRENKKSKTTDAIANLFELPTNVTEESNINKNTQLIESFELERPKKLEISQFPNFTQITESINSNNIKAISYQVHVNGLGINTSLCIFDEEDIAIAIALLEKIRRQLKHGLPETKK